jgi:hypothetical protein
VFVARTASNSVPSALIFIEDFSREASSLHGNRLFCVQYVALPGLGAGRQLIPR